MGVGGRAQGCGDRWHWATHGRLERGEGELVDPQGPGERVAAQPLDDLGVTEDEAGLGPAEQLVAAGGHDRRAGAQPGRRVGFVG